MMAKKNLSCVYKIDQNFQKSKRIDTDVAIQGLEGYYLHESGWRVVKNILENINSSKQRAYTITGPYGSGKSSLAILIAAALSTSKELRSKASIILGKDKSEQLYNILPNSQKGWMIATVVGSRTDIVDAIWSSLLKESKIFFGENHEIVAELSGQVKSLENLIKIFNSISKLLKKNETGFLLLIDEMGKLLEYAASEGGDLFPLQEIAETFSRKNDNCLMLGVLHQAFGDYGRRVGAHTQAEWAKIQGRFIDIPFSMGIDEIASLIGGAMRSSKTPDDRLHELSDKASFSVRGSFNSALSDALIKSGPLHPVTTLLLGPISRRRFGQNERSIFSFLSSHESGGFIEFLENEDANSDALYTPAKLWDYLQLNHEPSILASPDAPRWAEAAEAVLRATHRPTSTRVHVEIAKTIGLLDMFGRPYGINATDGLLETCLDPIAIDIKKKSDKNHNHSSNEDVGDFLHKTLEDLRSWSVAIPRRHAGGWGLFAGSDIDVDSELSRVIENMDNDDNAIISAMRDLSPIVAKRYYAETGTLRLFERKIVKYSDLKNYLEIFDQGTGPSGAFVLVLPNNSETTNEDQIIKDEIPGNKPVFVAEINKQQRLLELAKEVAALERLPSVVPQLHGDPVSRREVNAKLLASRALLAAQVRVEFDTTSWKSTVLSDRAATIGGLSALASEISEKIFHSTPKIHNELINKNYPSPTASAARRKLMNAMIANFESERLGIDGEPAELGLYLSLLRQTKLHIRLGKSNKYGFLAPQELSSLYPAWLSASEKIKSANVPVSFMKIYDLWKDAPFGMRDGVMPIFALAFYLSNKNICAVYIDGNFIPEPDEMFVDRLLISPNDVSIRQVMSDESWTSYVGDLGKFLLNMKLSKDKVVTPLDATKPLVQFALRLPNWTKKTKKISNNTLKIRDALIGASDPYSLLFVELPEAAGFRTATSKPGKNTQITELIGKLIPAISELNSAYPKLFQQFEDQIIQDLKENNDDESAKNKVSLRSKALNKKNLDLRLSRFIDLLASCECDRSWVESICSLASNRPIREWTDGDAERSIYEISQLCRRFLQEEAKEIARSSSGKTLNKAVVSIFKQLSDQGLNISEQRAVLLLALDNMDNEAGE